MAARVLVLHGPNLALAPPDQTAQVIDARLQAKANALGVELRTVQSNSEAALLDALVEQREWCRGVIVNPTSLAAIAFPLAEALKLVGVPAIEVQLGSPGKGKSALKDVVESQIHGRGVDGYLEALAQLAPKAQVKVGVVSKETKRAESRTSLQAVLAAAEKEAAAPGRAEREEEAAPPKPPKTLGRAGDRETPIVTRSVDRRVDKTIGERATASYTMTPPPKTLGRKPAAARKDEERNEPHGVLTRARVREQIAERLAGTMTPAALATWARARWADLQAGTAAESGQRERLEEVLQTLIVSAAQKASDQVLIELMVQLER